MKYIIMCGGHYKEWEKPRQLLTVFGEPIVARTIRQLKEAGVVDIAITADDPLFDELGVPVLHHRNDFYKDERGDWVDGFYPMSDPACYILGDVVFSPAAIKTIVETETDDIEMFGSAKPLPPEYPKKWIELFAFKVVDQIHFQESIRMLKEIGHTGWRSPLPWELWALIKGRRIDIDDYKVDYTVINDYTCDIDHVSEMPKLERRIRE